MRQRRRARPRVHWSNMRRPCQPEGTLPAPLPSSGQPCGLPASLTAYLPATRHFLPTHEANTCSRWASPARRPGHAALAQGKGQTHAQSRACANRCQGPPGQAGPAGPKRHGQPPGSLAGARCPAGGTHQGHLRPWQVRGLRAHAEGRPWPVHMGPKTRWNGRAFAPRDCPGRQAPLAQRPLPMARQSAATRHMVPGSLCACLLAHPPAPAPTPRGLVTPRAVRLPAGPVASLAHLPSQLPGHSWPPGFHDAGPCRPCAVCGEGPRIGSPCWPKGPWPALGHLYNCPLVHRLASLAIPDGAQGFCRCLPQVGRAGGGGGMASGSVEGLQGH